MPARTRIARPLAVALSVASVAIAAPARAQDAAATTMPAPARDSMPAAPSTPATPAPAGPTVASAAVGVRHTTTAANTANAQQRRGGYGQPMALMVVGGAAVLVGLLIGGGAGTAIAIAGAVAGLYGLYQYLQ